jgi:hypothetical protein
MTMAAEPVILFDDDLQGGSTWSVTPGSNLPQTNFGSWDAEWFDSSEQGQNQLPDDYLSGLTGSGNRVIWGSGVFPTRAIFSEVLDPLPDVHHLRGELIPHISPSGSNAWSQSAGRLVLDLEPPGSFETVSITPQLDSIRDRLRSAKSRIEQQNRDDEEGSFNELVFDRASSFVLAASASFASKWSKEPPIPSITLGPSESIDIVWRYDERSLYINIPREPIGIITFFGMDLSNHDMNFRGESDESAEGWILGWLVKK